MQLRTLCFLLLLFVFCQCKKSDNNTGTPTTSNTEKLKREHGQPNGPLVKQTIGASGGTLVSADGGLTLSVPAGAVDAATEFSVQPVENKLQTKGKSYRLLPEGVAFKKPVTLTFSYAATPVRTEEAKYLFPVYQDATGYYYQPKTVQHNAAAKTLTVQTEHFSDWTFTSRLELEVAGNVNNGTVELHKGESVSLTVVKYLTGETTDAYKNEVPVLEDKGFATRATITWSKSSASGTLLPLGTHAVYTAPAAITQAENLVVTVTVDDSNLGMDNLGNPIKQMTLVQPVALLPDSPANDESFFELQEDGTTYRSRVQHFSPLSTLTTVTGDFTGRSITLTVNSAAAASSYVYGEPGLAGKATIDYTVANTSIFVHFRMDDCANPHEIHYSPGQVTFSKIAQSVGDYTEGTFSGEVYAYDWCPSHQQKILSGRFKIRKDY